MKDTVYMVTQLDRDYGFAVKRRVFILSSANNSKKILSKIAIDKNVLGMLTTSKEVLYS